MSKNSISFFQITFSLPNADTLTEKHIRIENPNDPGETYYYTVENDYLVLVDLEHCIFIIYIRLEDAK